jgi:maltose alpha-D-glucosyltransferase/alpha-amylase
MIIDFEGEPSRSIGERRIKRSPLRDVAGMIRSFHYASHAALLQQLELGIMQPDTLAKLQPWSRFWYGWISATFLTAYQELIESALLLPQADEELSLLLYAHLLEKAVYELGYELNHRPAWLKIPLEGVIELLEFRKT